MRRHSAITSVLIWLAYSPLSPTELAILAVNRKGLLSADLEISSQAFSSLRQIANRPSCCVAPLITSAKGLGEAGSAGLDAAAKGGLATAAGSATVAAGAEGCGEGGVGGVGGEVARKLAHALSINSAAAPTAPRRKRW